ncbi:glycosyltransferase [Sphingobacterium siyangense]|uniref:glycosyltransferase family 2 protein n=1 Tax=Sphingobacterium siyangense TaxID=459529 RepID=UPI00200D1C2D|nr:glycosyltransferase [Sphingobacterium siyangense]UQA75606.1 glycosyltransferase [Sphingobacterium siyangense]
MNSHVLVSVVVPIYNVEEYLPGCIDSILSQTYSSLEVILVDDGSPDSCGKICEEYAVKDARIKVLHKENGGLSDARNAGLEIAKGEYVWFVDSDDSVSTTALKDIVSTVSEQDLVVFDADFIYNTHNRRTVYKGIEEGKIYSGFDFMSKVTFYGAWNILYKRSFLNKYNFRFYKGLLHEDMEFLPRVFAYAEKVTYKPVIGLNYIAERPGSIMQSISLKRLSAAIEILNSHIKFVKANHYSDDQVKIIMKKRWETFLPFFVKAQTLSKDDRRAYYRLLRVNREALLYCFNHTDKSAKKIQAAFLKFSPVGFFKFRYWGYNILRKIKLLPF